MQKIRVNKWLVGGFYLFGAVGLFAFAFWDLDISLRLYDSENLFGKFMELFGDYPLYLMLGFGSVYLFMEEKRFLWAVGSLAGAALCGVLPFYRGSGAGIWSFLAALLFLALFAMAARLAPEGQREGLHRLAVYAVIYFVASQVIAYSIKIPWGRLRFRHMEDPVALFTPWYLPQGITGNYSFPSGHTFNACSVFLLLYLPGIWKRKGKEWILWVLCSLWTALVAISRIIAGAHFASDVTMGAMLGVGLFLFMNRSQRGKKNSFSHALDGISHVAKSEKNFKIELALGGTAFGLCAFFKVTRGEWLAVLLCCMIVLALEAANTGIERTVDLVTEEQQELARQAKDAAAGAVLLAAAGALAVGAVIFIPYITNTFY